MNKRNIRFNNTLLNNRLNWLIIGLMLFFNLPIFISQTTVGLDPSYIYLFNIAASKGLKFGTDLFITYGPLGFLVSTQNYDNNIVINIIFWSLMFVIQTFSLYKIIIQRNVNFIITLISFILIIPLYRIGAEYYLLYVIILVISLAWFDRKQLLYFLLACLLTVLMMFIKFSGAIGAISSIILFVLSMIIKDKKKGLQLALFTLCIPILFVLGFMLYNPSFAALKDYVISAMEISTGYNSAMSLFIPTFLYFFETSLAIILSVGYLALMFFLLYKKKDKGLYIQIFIGTIFLTFKHGFVRYDINHSMNFFYYYLALLSVIILNFDNKYFLNKMLKKPKHHILLLSISIIAVLLIFSVNSFRDSVIRIITTKINSILVIPDQIKNNLVDNEKDVLSKEILDSIGTNAVLIYPWELSIDAYNNINSVFMPIPQSYTAYTPYLDKKNADFISNKRKSPKYILFCWENWNDVKGTIDNRFALIESPDTWLQIYRNYSAIYSDKEHYLVLKHKKQVPELEFKKIYSKSFHKSDWIKIPNSKSIITMRANISYNFFGKIMKLLFHVPSTYMEVVYENNILVMKRILPEVLVNPTIISNLPTNMKSAQLLLNGNTDIEKVKMIRLHKNRFAWFLYNDNIEISFFNIK